MPTRSGADVNHDEMVALIRAGVARPGGVWADLGAGTGNFTRALAALLGPAATIYALDRDAKAIHTLQEQFARGWHGATVIPRQADVTRQLDLPLLDGVLLANLLHFIRDQHTFLEHIAFYLRPGGRILVVEYEQPHPIAWVPYPVPFERLEALARDAGFGLPVPAGTRRSPSSGRSMYAASMLVAPEAAAS